MLVLELGYVKTIILILHNRIVLQLETLPGDFLDSLFKPYLKRNIAGGLMTILH